MVAFWSASAFFLVLAVHVMKLRGDFQQNSHALCLYVALPNFCCLGFVASCVKNFCAPLSSFYKSWIDLMAFQAFSLLLLPLNPFKLVLFKFQGNKFQSVVKIL